MTTLEDRAARSAAEVMSWSRELLQPALQQAIGELPESMRDIAEYHMGGVGKALRPTLVLLTAEAVGGCATSALPAAVAVELVHNFSLLHDDIMDADITRRHRPTAWSVFGVNQAILAGDALLGLAMLTLADHPKAARMLGATVQKLVEGQSADLTFERRNDVTLAECVQMAQRKTAALLECCCALGTLLGGGTTDQIRQLSCFGARLGLAFQIVDDLLGIWGDPAVTGKPVHSDLRSRKKTLPVVAALISENQAGRELSRMYGGSGALSREDVVRAARLVEEAGGRTWSIVQIDEQLSHALQHLRSAGLTPHRAAELDALAQLATRRDF